MILAGFPPTTVIGGTIMSHDAVCSHYRAVADPHAGQNCGIDAYPYLVFDDDRASVCGAAVVRVGVVVDCDEVHFRGDEHVVAQCDASSVEECASLLNPATFPHAYVLAEIHIERSLKSWCKYKVVEGE